MFINHKFNTVLSALETGCSRSMPVDLNSLYFTFSCDLHWIYVPLQDDVVYLRTALMESSKGWNCDSWPMKRLVGSSTAPCAKISNIVQLNTQHTHLLMCQTNTSCSFGCFTGDASYSEVSPPVSVSVSLGAGSGSNPLAMSASLTSLLDLYYFPWSSNHTVYLELLSQRHPGGRSFSATLNLVP